MSVASPEQIEITTDSSLRRAAWDLSWPLVIDGVAISLACLTDTWVAGKLGGNAQPAIALGSQIWFLMLFLAMALSVGTNALVSRSWGAKDTASAITATRQSIMAAFVLGGVATLLGLLTCHSLLKLLGATQGVETLGWNYLKFSLPALLPLTVLWTCHSVFQAQGNTRTPMFILSATIVLICVLDLVFCLGPPAFGIEGIGLSWLTASICGCISAMVALKHSELGAAIDGRLLRFQSFSSDWLWRMLKVGVPACLQDLSWVFGNFVLLMILGCTVDPPSAEASWAVGVRIEDALALMPITALSMATSTIIGQEIGAGRAERAEQVGWKLVIMTTVFCMLTGAIMFFFATPLAHVMSGSANTRLYSAQYLQLAGLSEPFLGVWLVLLGALQGAGYTLWPMIVSGICLMALRLPLSYYLTVTLGWGPLGAWIAMACACVLACLWMTYLYKTGKWKSLEI